jgi:glutathione S-transferase
MSITLYGTPPSPPSHSVRLMLEHKGLDHKVVWLLPGLHPALLRTRGFRGGTVPAIKIDGRKLQQSREISRALEDLKPEPHLFPTDPEQRAAVEEAERWGDETLQDVPRRVVRWLAAHQQRARVQIARDAKIPLPSFAAAINAPVARYMANKVDSDAEIQNAVAAVPDVIGHVDGLIADGVIGGEQPNAADLQIATSVRAILTVEDLSPAFEGHPAAEHARRFLPELGSEFPAGSLPAEMLAPLRG